MSFILRRLVFYLVAAWVALTINFFIPRAMPGNAVQSIMSKFPNLQPSAYHALEAMLGVGHPGSIWSQYWSYLVDVFHLNFGTDVSQYPAQVSTLLGETIPWTLTLVGMATVIAFLIGTALGIVAGWRHGGTLDRVLPGLMFLQAIPYFFFALILVELLAIKVHVFPIGQGYAQGLIPRWHWDFISSAIYHSLLPALTIVLTSIAGWMLQMRNVMITTIGEDYVIAAQAKGLPNSVDAWHSDVASGNFQLTSHWSNGGLTPYNMYEGWLDSSLATGNAATGDYERLNSPAMNAALATLAGAETTAQQTAALAPIAQFVAANLPIIPTTTASQWFEYNSQNYTGWPTQDNPYETGQPSGTNNGPGSGPDEVVILHLSPR